MVLKLLLLRATEEDTIGEAKEEEENSDRDPNHDEKNSLTDTGSHFGSEAGQKQRVVLPKDDGDRCWCEDCGGGEEAGAFRETEGKMMVEGVMVGWSHRKL